MVPLVNPRRTAEILRKHHFRPSKTLGQNFLVDANILYKIMETANLSPNDVILEIGAGIGTLTEAISPKVKLVITVEYDRTLLSILSETLKELSNVEIIRADALKFDISQLPSTFSLPNKMVSNLPYQIASPLLIKMLKNYSHVRRYVVMVQKEAAERILAEPGSENYSAFTLKIQYFSEMRFIANVSRRVFIPQPNVDSAIILLERLKKPRIRIKDELLLFNIITAAFKYRRKMIKNALLQSDSLTLGRDEIETALVEAGIDEKSRGEQLTLNDFGMLSDAFALLQKKS